MPAISWQLTAQGWKRQVQPPEYHGESGKCVLLRWHGTPSTALLASGHRSVSEPPANERPSASLMSSPQTQSVE